MTRTFGSTSEGFRRQALKLQSTVVALSVSRDTNCCTFFVRMQDCAVALFFFQKLDTAGSSQTPLPESASELYQPSSQPLWVKLVPTFAYRGCHVVSVTDPKAVLSVF
jgi:hypothetical protein